MHLPRPHALTRARLPGLLPAILLPVLLAACGESPRGGPGAADSVAAAGAAPDTQASGGGASTPLADPVAAYLARQPSGIFVREGACPFECCVYRTWHAEAAIPVRARPEPSAPVVDTLPPGEDFEALGGHVRIEPTQIVVLLDSLRAFHPDGGGDTLLAASDTLVPLDYVGEGYVNVWADGGVWQVPLSWGGTGSPGDSTRARAVGERTTRWWVRVRSPTSGEGWILADSAKFGNADRCG